MRSCALPFVGAVAAMSAVAMLACCSGPGESVGSGPMPASLNIHITWQYAGDSKMIFANDRALGQGEEGLNHLIQELLVAPPGSSVVVQRIGSGESALSGVEATEYGLEGFSAWDTLVEVVRVRGFDTNLYVCR